MVNYVKVTNRKTFQNKIFPELNSKKHTVTNRLIFTKLRNCENLSFAKAEKGNFARNDFCEWLRKLLFFPAKLMRKERKILRFVPQKLHKSFANGNPSSGMKDTFSLNKLFSFIEQFYYFVTANNSKVSFIFWGHICKLKNRE